jgi:hypothetical protein
VARRRWVRGELTDPLGAVFAVKVNLGCDESVELADRGGVKVHGVIDFLFG